MESITKTAVRKYRKVVLTADDTAEVIGAMAELGSKESGFGVLGVDGIVGSEPSVPRLGEGNTGIRSGDSAGGREMNGVVVGRVDGEAEMEEEEEVEREWEERMERRRAEWRKRVEEMLGHHRLQMAQIQARVLNEQQAVVGQLLGLVSHWAGGGGVGGGGGDGAHANGVVVMPGENRRGVGRGDGQEEQFILDG